MNGRLVTCRLKLCQAVTAVTPGGAIESETQRKKTREGKEAVRVSLFFSLARIRAIQDSLSGGPAELRNHFTSL